MTKKESNKIYRETHKEELKKYMKIYRQNHKIEISELQKEWYKLNKQKILIQRKKYRCNHKKYIREWRLRNHNKLLLYYKKYREEHKEQIKKYQKEHQKERHLWSKRKMKKSISFRMTKYLRTRIYNALKYNYKSQSTIKLLGCSIDFLKKYLQLKFQSGMSFENYGKWHVDHIKPCAKFDLSKASEQKKCFNYTNLQPLWAEDNLRKHSKLEE